MSLYFSFVNLNALSSSSFSAVLATIIPTAFKVMKNLS